MTTTTARPDVAHTTIVPTFDDKPGAWFKRGFFVGLGLLASMPAALIALYVVLRAFAEST